MSYVINIPPLTIIFLLALSTLLVSPASYSEPVESDPSTSVFRFQKTMAEKGNSASQYKLAMMYETGTGVKADLRLARIWYTRAARQDYTPAKHRLTYLDIKEYGFSEKYRPWLNELEKDALYGNGEAVFLQGQMYAHGIGYKKDLGQAVRLLRKAAASNIPGADSERIRAEKELDQIALKKKQINDRALAKQVAKRKQQSEAQRREREAKLAREKQRQQKLAEIAQSERIKRRKAAYLNQHEQRQQAMIESQEAILAREFGKPIEPRKEVFTSVKPAAGNSGSDNDLCSGRNRFNSTCR